ncbi:hypothetical protein A2707_01245 [Candidatus Saccharibacteria bacterium RIFCSPHIGHO2_01_FULL_45_15]|jgi:hypothetical protein|nr:MAG: hypothetical protein A2707_01245 [Candidatus Saccharibacteria bacterium RIFCSPHIGHO2_01_FULL_45_15]OGL26992.1 MAG: hypothetical protein A3C39_02360 [Candidatus Saccharibacteria bacterium RIFCSPHIGHO2_02_FULL_46_12]OGL32903.1 MAG: hypothetical protein A3E76_06080 [Candidatus Saccharibacteria bacterium RIFCSPHIGHO2_12_FULL_44_22]
MYQSFKSSLSSWSEETTDRQKLQHTYVAVAVLLLVAAGVIGLLNQSLGQQILALAIAAAAIFLINAVAWALLQSSVLLRLNDRSMARPTATTRKTTKTTKK